MAGNSAHTAPTSAGDIAKTSGVFGSKLGSKDNLADLSASLNVVSAIPADIDVTSLLRLSDSFHLCRMSQLWVMELIQKQSWSGNWSRLL